MAVIVVEALMDQIPQINIPTLFTVLQSCNDIININTHGLFSTRRILLSKAMKNDEFVEGKKFLFSPWPSGIF